MRSGAGLEYDACLRGTTLFLGVLNFRALMVLARFRVRWRGKVVVGRGVGDPF